MNPMAIGRLAALLLVVGKIEANEQPTPCSVYFSVVENDEVSVHLSVLGMNRPQTSWYKMHGDRDKYAGICYVEDGARAPAEAPLYAIVWGEHLVSEPYVYSYQTAVRVDGDVNATVTDQNGNTSTVSGTNSTGAPVSHTGSGTKKYYVADGWLAVWNPKTSEGKGSFVPIVPLQNHNNTDLSSASTSLLKDAMEQIKQREKERLAVAAKERQAVAANGRNGSALITIRPINNGQPSPSETSSSAVTSTVGVSSTPPGANIFVDEDFVGTTPSTINVTAGKHAVTVKKSGFQDWICAVSFSGGSITLDAKLASEPNEMRAADPPTTSDSKKGSAPAGISANSLQKPVGWLGVSGKDNNKGALVTDVTAGGPAERAGIRMGDTILEVAGTTIKGKDFEKVVAALKPGTQVPVNYTRGSSVHEVWIMVTSHN
jgi:hypothetical protein